MLVPLMFVARRIVAMEGVVEGVVEGVLEGGGGAEGMGGTGGEGAGDGGADMRSIAIAWMLAACGQVVLCMVVWWCVMCPSKCGRPSSSSSSSSSRGRL